MSSGGMVAASTVPRMFRRSTIRRSFVPRVVAQLALAALTTGATEASAAPPGASPPLVTPSIPARRAPAHPVTTTPSTPSARAPRTSTSKAATPALLAASPSRATKAPADSARVGATSDARHEATPTDERHDASPLHLSPVGSSPTRKAPKTATAHATSPTTSPASAPHDPAHENTPPGQLEIFTPEEMRAFAVQRKQERFERFGVTPAEQDLLDEVMGVLPNDDVRARGKALGMTPFETAAVRGYTGFGYDPMNKAMHAGGEAKARLAPLLDSLEAGIAKLPRSSGVAYRSQSMRGQTWSVGEIVELPGAVSTSRRVRAGAEAMLVIRYHDGADVAALSAYPGEEEILFWSPSFRVTGKRMTETGLVYDVEQVRPGPLASPSAAKGAR